MFGQLTKFQKNFISRHRQTGIRFYISDSLTGKRMTIRTSDGNGGYFLTIPDDIDAQSKLQQVKEYLKTGNDIGCTEKAIIDEFDYEIPF
jgi:hypothetical protein